MNATLLEARALSRRRPDADAWLLEDISLSLRAGERLALSGPSGAGKTLLMRTLALLDGVDAGEVLWHGQPVANAQVPAYRSQVMYLHQRPVLFDGDVETNLRLPFELRTHRDHRYDESLIVAYLDYLGRDATLLTRQSQELSGGEGQIVALLRAVQLHPTVLLLDEPTASLDPSAVQAVERLVERWFAEGAGTRAVVWVSHDAVQAARVADRQLRLRAGRLREEA